MSVEENKALVRRWFDMEDFRGIKIAEIPEAEVVKLINSVVDEIFAPDFVRHSPLSNIII